MAEQASLGSALAGNYEIKPVNEFAGFAQGYGLAQKDKAREMNQELLKQKRLSQQQKELNDYVKQNSGVEGVDQWDMPAANEIKDKGLTDFFSLYQQGQKQEALRKLIKIKDDISYLRSLKDNRENFRKNPYASSDALELQKKIADNGGDIRKVIGYEGQLGDTAVGQNGEILYDNTKPGDYKGDIKKSYDAHKGLVSEISPNLPGSMVGIVKSIPRTPEEAQANREAIAKYYNMPVEKIAPYTSIQDIAQNSATKGNLRAFKEDNSDWIRKTFYDENGKLKVSKEEKEKAIHDRFFKYVEDQSPASFSMQNKAKPAKPESNANLQNAPASDQSAYNPATAVTDIYNNLWGNNSFLNDKKNVAVKNHIISNLSHDFPTGAAIVTGENKNTGKKIKFRGSEYQDDTPSFVTNGKKIFYVAPESMVQASNSLNLNATSKVYGDKLIEVTDKSNSEIRNSLATMLQANIRMDKAANLEDWVLKRAKKAGVSYKEEKSATSSTTIPTITTQSQYDSLPKGSKYKDSTGKTATKK